MLMCKQNITKYCDNFSKRGSIAPSFKVQFWSQTTYGLFLSLPLAFWAHWVIKKKKEKGGGEGRGEVEEEGVTAMEQL